MLVRPHVRTVQALSSLPLILSLHLIQKSIWFSWRIATQAIPSVHQSVSQSYQLWQHCHTVIVSETTTFSSLGLVAIGKRLLVKETSSVTIKRLFCFLFDCDDLPLATGPHCGKIMSVTVTFHLFCDLTWLLATYMLSDQISPFSFLHHHSTPAPPLWTEKEQNYLEEGPGAPQLI